MRLHAVVRSDGRDCIEPCLRAMHMSDGDRSIQLNQRRRFESEQRIIVNQNACPIGRGRIGCDAVERGDARLKMVFAQILTLGGGGQLDQPGLDESHGRCIGACFRLCNVSDEAKARTEILTWPPLKPTATTPKSFRLGMNLGCICGADVIFVCCAGRSR